MIEYLRGLVDEGLMGPEGFTQSDDEAVEKLLSEVLRDGPGAAGTGPPRGTRRLPPGERVLHSSRPVIDETREEFTA
ncbi:hypothetical protein RKD33_005915 [Streptomyces sp. SAI-129]